jgi:hypothetical protein
MKWSYLLGLGQFQMEEPEDRIEQAIVFVASVCSSRALAVSFFYWSGCLMLGTGGWKAFVVFCLTYIAQVLPLGQRRIERFGLLFLAVATVYWVDIVPMHEWTLRAKAATDALQSENSVIGPRASIVER